MSKPLLKPVAKQPTAKQRQRRLRTVHQWQRGQAAVPGATAPEDTACAPWQQRYFGKRWKDMPGNDSDTKKIHFALWRRGLVKLIEDEETTHELRQMGDRDLEDPDGENAEPEAEAKMQAQAKAKAVPLGRGAGELRGRPRRVLPQTLKQCDAAEVAVLAGRIRQEVALAGLTAAEACLLGGLKRNALQPYRVAKAGTGMRARMVALLERLVQRNHPTRGKEGA